VAVFVGVAEDVGGMGGMSSNTATKTCARCGCEFKSNKRNAVLCTPCWKDEGNAPHTVSERGRTGYRAVDANGMIEDDYTEMSGRG